MEGWCKAGAAKGKKTKPKPHRTNHFNIAEQCLEDLEARSVIPWKIQESSMAKLHLVYILSAVRPREIISEVS